MTRFTTKRSIAIIGGGAAGYFAALTAAECDPSADVTIYESGRRTLTKVKISGGGRCNVTHSCFEAKRLASHYPRGSRELLGAFHRWQARDTIQWFAERGVTLKTEADGRMFPTTDESQTIIDCFEKEAGKLGVRLVKSCGLDGLSIEESAAFSLEFSDGSQGWADKVCLAAGSLKGSKLLRSLEVLGHHIEPLAPSLFAFNLSDTRTHGLSGLSVQDAVARTSRKGSAQRGPILITHRGLSGPAILRLSAWEAPALQEQNYHFEIFINWLGGASEAQVREEFNRLRKGKTLVKTKVFEQLPRRLWERLIKCVGISDEQKWAQLPKDTENALIQELTAAQFSVQGKTTNKDEFVTCGGVRLKEVDFRRMESKLLPGLHFAGECLDIDGITGGFNFQAAWTTAHIAGTAMAE
ncbi:MAG: NAD(P)/FAD-dependent oxidoreductase [Opitutales bacterium]